MGVLDLLFSFNGRITRSQYWLGQLALVGLILVVFLIWAIGLAGTLGPDFQTLSQQEQTSATLSVLMGLAFAFLFTIVLICWIGAALAIKRLHDRGKSGWSTLMYAVPGVVSAIAPLGIFLVLSMAMNAWIFFELGFLKGDDGANPFGPGTVDGVNALVSREIAELERAAQPKKAPAPLAPALNLPGTPAGVVKPRASRATAAERSAAGFGRRSPRIA